MKLSAFKYPKQLKTVLAASFLVAGALIFTSCSSQPKTLPSDAAKTQTDGGSTASETSAQSKAVLDKAHAVSVKVAAKTGGIIGLNASKDIKIRIAIPRESLTKDTEIEAAPLLKAPTEDQKTLAKGFSLEEKGTGKGPLLKLPATIIFSLRGQMPLGTTIVKYHEVDEGFDAIPTTVTNKNGFSIVSASVSGFSKYGVRKDEGQSNNKSDSGRSQAQDKNNSAAGAWVVNVNDSYSFNYGSLKVTASINLKAVNSSGKVDGIYKGTVTGKLDQSAENGGMSLTAPTVSKDNNLNFVVSYPLADLVPLDPESEGLPLAPLTTPENEPDWSGFGTFNMFTSGTATVTGRGRTASGAVKAPRSATPFEMNVKGSQVRLVVKHPNQTLYFDGTLTQQ